ncbi:transaldolase [Microbacterium sp. 1.5R]|uniref:transaldolase n=1 Tax=Microbacterium TaxID=33882 RepID=UPI00069D7A40|nr:MULTISPECIES: transaldolase [unclassified Microbacterium]AKV85795.1 transaldolase [Microbacterium sp. CGR1]APH45211.1 transaldolase [Microbacterium sp. 1.5R]KRD52414.1 transaldolase [Microbacterium sp. Root280D1]MDY0983071.1 transaldolase [Microbacterium sp. CFBP9023]CAH0183284.1 Transaldolase [Microbacterium sp. Bi98]
MSTPTADLAAAGVSIWLDDLSRTRISSGNLAELIESRNVVGVTTNPTIFANAITDKNNTSYDAQVTELAASGATAEEAVFAATTQDVAAALDVFRPVWEKSGHVDGRVSIEVSPDLAHDTEGTVAQAKQLWAKVDRPNLLVKIPATKAGLPAITEAIASGISVNVTLIFSLERYAEVIDAYLTGLERAHSADFDLSSIHSVASFFVSRVDTETDKRLSAIGTDEAEALKSKAGLANARLAYELYEQKFAEKRAQDLIKLGANPQRPLWASTGVKDPALPDTLYVTELVAKDVVNTMPEKTLEATFDHGVVTGDTITGGYDEARAVFAGLADLGIDFTDVTQVLEDEGVAKFIDSWHDLLTQVAEGLEAQR